MAGDDRLTGATWKQKLHVSTLLVRQAGRRFARLATPRRLAGRLRASAPKRLLIAPQDIRTSDPTIAVDLASGYFAFGGKIVTATGRSPFVGESGSEQWMRQLASFGWLRHLRAADAPGDRARGRVLVEQFLDAMGTPSNGVAWQPRVAARRLMSWLSQSPVILADADLDFYTRFTRALDRHNAYLRAELSRGLAGSDRLLVALAAAEYGLCVESDPGLERRGTDLLGAEIAAQVLADGGHISRNPQAIIGLLLDLLPLRQAYAARALPPPAPMLNAIDRMMPMLRLFRHGDGALALFNGMGPTAPELVATILAYDDVSAQPMVNARPSGYGRAEHEGTLLIVDAGAPPPAAFSASAHAGCLSFELSSGASRLVVNCGACDGARPEVRSAFRSTAAHSTLVIDDTSSCRFAANTGVQRWLGEQILSGPVQVSAERAETAEGTRLTLSHDGYVQPFGLIHHRTLLLAADGLRLDGHDRLEPAGSRAGPADGYLLRFHLHPSTKARVDGASIRLDTPGGGVWLFEADADAVLEPSILFAAASGPRPSTQIKVVPRNGTPDGVRWRFQQRVRDARRR